jgi:hypothetical protein
MRALGGRRAALRRLDGADAGADVATLTAQLEREAAAT